MFNLLPAQPGRAVGEGGGGLPSRGEFPGVVRAAGNPEEQATGMVFNPRPNPGAKVLSPYMAPEAANRGSQAFGTSW